MNFAKALGCVVLDKFVPNVSHVIVQTGNYFVCHKTQVLTPDIFVR